ncbi:MAG: hypothetical protein AABY18_03910 [Candidatus Thermoplasmatota archaeon]
MDGTPWKAIALAVMALPQHGKLHVPRNGVPHPSDAGLYRSLGLARKCRHYRRALPDGRGLHVHEYADHYRVHWDAIDPSISFFRHVWHDVKHAIQMRGKHAPPVAFSI